MDKTFSIIKPDATKRKITGSINKLIEDSGLKIVAQKLIKLSENQAKEFYSIHKDKPFYEELTNFMSSGKTMVIALEKNDAVEEWRKTIGSTNPQDAEDGTIRKLYASSLGENAVHGSDSDENAKKEIGFFFSDMELL